MRLSERGAVRAAIAEGGFHLYPAGKMIDYLKQALPDDTLKGDFDPQTTAEKLSRVTAPSDENAKKIFEEDLSLLCTRLKELDPDYDIQAVFAKMAQTLPQLARRYYGIEGFNPLAPQVVEYFFEGHNEIYKDADWFAFNVTAAESQQLNVPAGNYFKRDQISPGQTEFAVIHEANHAMQEIAAMPTGVHHYVPWLDEGLADILGRMMLFAITENEKLLKNVKFFKTEVEVTDSRKMTYHFGEETAALLLLRGRLPLVRAILAARREDPFAFDWSELAASIKSGVDPHIGIVSAYRGSKKDMFQKRLNRNETNFRKETDLNQADLKVLTMFLAAQPPAILPAAEYRTALYFMEEINKDPSPHVVDSQAVPEGLRPRVPEWKPDSILPFSSIPQEVLNKVPGIKTRVAIKAADIPEERRAGADALANKYFVIKRQIADTIIYEPHGGGLPIRLRSGEIRCAW